MKLNGRIIFVPRFIIVSTLHAQVIENNRDKSGCKIDPFLHIYNSRITLERIHQFIELFFPDVSEYCDFLEFPSYEKNSFPRFFFFCLYNFIPIDSDILDKLFAIKGNVVDERLSSSDHMKQFFGYEANPYVSLHLFYNLIFSKANTLRFGSDATEAQFHVVAMSLYKELVLKKHILLDEIERKAEQFARHFFAYKDETIGNCDFINWKSLTISQSARFATESQVSVLPAGNKIHAQIGMKNIHATYYKHPDEPSLYQILETGQYSLDSLRECGRDKKAKRLELAFNKSVNCVGKEEYFKFLRCWESRYLHNQVNKKQTMENSCEQISRIKNVICSVEKACEVLNYNLFEFFPRYSIYPLVSQRL